MWHFPSMQITHILLHEISYFFSSIISYVLVPPLIPFSIINKISMWVDSSNCTFAFVNATCHANPGAEKSRVWLKYYNAPASKGFKYVI